MCQSAEVSLGTWAFGMISAWALSNSSKFPVFPFVVTQMQLVEGLRWLNAVDERILAVLGKLVLYAQPAAGLQEAGAKSFILPQLLAQLGVELLFGSRDLRFVVAEDGHFRWKWLEAPLITQVPQWIGLTQAAYRLFPVWLNTLLIGLQAYQIQHHRKYHTDGSLWCVSVNLMWLQQLLK